MPPKALKKKICVVGPTAVGKTSLIQYIKTGSFQDGLDVTTSVAIVSINQTLPDSDEPIVLNFWDTAGQERYKSMGPMYYQGASACVGVFDFNSATSFKEMQEYIEMFREHSQSANPIIIVCGNKIDLCSSSNLSQPDYSQWADDNQIPLFQTSAVTGSGVLEFLAYLTESLSPEKEETLDSQNADVDKIAIVTQSESEKKCC